MASTIHCLRTWRWLLLKQVGITPRATERGTVQTRSMCKVGLTMQKGLTCTLSNGYIVQASPFDRIFGVFSTRSGPGVTGHSRNAAKIQVTSLVMLRHHQQCFMVISKCVEVGVY